MPMQPELTDRERQVLEAVIQSYVETAEPAASRTLSRRFGLGVSPATIRNTMSDLEEKGFLFHPHTSAGRVPTDLAYRVYVDSLLCVPVMQTTEAALLGEEINGASTAIESILRRAAQSLGVLTQELGVALGPQLDSAILQRVELVRLSSDRLLMVLALERGVARSIYIELPIAIADNAIGAVGQVLNERLGGLTLREIRSSLALRLRDAQASGDASELLNIFVEEGEQYFANATRSDDAAVVIGQPSLLAEHPEFATGESMRQLLAFTETPAHIADVLRRRSPQPGITITIGNEHGDPRLDRFTIVTAEYHFGSLSGVIGVIGPTRMPYRKVISLVGHASRLVSDLL
ncbi:MAG TPA: heat-inducible transcriptional repressor HrcA [Gemmatimonadaceae bacterium]|nr:heat-inducible transcriptional repressor HrcA [Gemmatimonadaceae bacterium]